ncbi:MAG TPA: outer membrane protein assembly factor BamE [Stellaceae bacterium]|nr:outer membrane protein assembly factor BamE [Stellaceae bacterium]
MIGLPRFCTLTLAAGGLAAALGACQATIDQRGNLPPPDAISQIKPGSTDRATVTRLIGSPSSVASFDPNTWYYISAKSKELAFFRPQIIDQQVIVITFDKDGVVSDMRKLGQDDATTIEPVARTTPAPGKELSFIEQLLGNFGRFNPGSGTSTAGKGAGGTNGP